MLSDLAYRLRALFRRRAMEDELEEELRFHLERQEEKYRRAGMTEKEAERRTRLDFGGPAQVRERCRDARGTRWLEEFVQDLRYAVRAGRKSPAFAVTVAVTIAAGIGASTAVFSVTNAVLLRPLPYRDPERLVLVLREDRRADTRSFLYSNADFLDLRGGTAAIFEDVGGVASFRAYATGGDGAVEQVSRALVTTSFFRLMGARIALGRDFTDADGVPQPAEPGVLIPPGSAAILSHEYWQRRYGGNPSVLGRELPASEGARSGPRIVGVLSPGFRLYFPPAARTDASPDFWVANNIGYDAAHRNLMTVGAVGRLKAGVTLEQAQQRLDALAPQLRKSSFDPNASLRLEPMRDYLVKEVRPAILALMGAVLFLLLIACANVANLMLVRASQREREFAVRAALGGSGRRLARQVLAETLLLAGLGTLLGVAFAGLAIRALVRLAPAGLPRIDSTTLDWRVLAFAAAAGLASAAVFGLAPALRAFRPGLADALRSGRAADPGRGTLVRNGVVIAEVALSFVLLVGSGLMFRSFLELRRVDPGYDPHGILTFTATRDWPLPKQEGRIELLREVQARLRALPGVENATAALVLPLAGGLRIQNPGGRRDGTPAGSSEGADYQQVLPGYFETLRTRVIAGRTFTEGDNVPGRNVAVIDDLLAARAFPGGPAVGKRIRVPDPSAPWAEVVGVVAHQRLFSLADPGRGTILFCDGSRGIGVSRSWIVRTAGDPAKYAAAVRAAIAQADRRIAVSKVQPMQALVDRDQAGTRLSLLLLGSFAAIAVLLAGVGLYGVLATVVRLRRSEMGVRIALGAAPAGVARLVAGHGVRLTVAGLVIGCVAALGLTRAMTTMLVGVGPADPITYLAMIVLFLAVAAAASWPPARRAARLDPAEVLREG